MAESECASVKMQNKNICCYFCFITTFLIAPSTTLSLVEVCTLQERWRLPCAAQSGTDGENMKRRFCLVACARLEMDSVNLGRRSQDWHTKAEEKFRHALHNQTLKAKNTTISHFTLNYMTYVQNSLRKGDRMNGAGWRSGDAHMGGTWLNLTSLRSCPSIHAAPLSERS